MIQVTFHNSRGCHNSDDIERARRAAADYLDAVGVDPAEAYAAYRAERQSGLRGSPLSEVWAIAQEAADEAALRDWVNPADVFVEISA